MATQTAAAARTTPAAAHTAVVTARARIPPDYQSRARLDGETAQLVTASGAGAPRASLCRGAPTRLKPRFRGVPVLGTPQCPRSRRAPRSARGLPLSARYVTRIGIGTVRGGRVPQAPRCPVACAAPSAHPGPRLVL
jgi:hypothetical protein